MRTTTAFTAKDATADAQVVMQHMDVAEDEARTALEMADAELRALGATQLQSSRAERLAGAVSRLLGPEDPTYPRHALYGQRSFDSEVMDEFNKLLQLDQRALLKAARKLGKKVWDKRAARNCPCAYSCT